MAIKIYHVGNARGSHCKMKQTVKLYDQYMRGQPCFGYDQIGKLLFNQKLSVKPRDFVDVAVVRAVIPPYANLG